MQIRSHIHVLQKKQYHLFHMYFYVFIPPEFILLFTCLTLCTVKHSEPVTDGKGIRGII